jgi:hypothetical protein
MRLNDRQKWVLIATAILLVAELIYAPTARCSYQGCYPTGYYDLIWDRGLNQQVHISGLMLTWTGTLLVAGIVLFLLQDGPRVASHLDADKNKTALRSKPSAEDATMDESPALGLTLDEPSSHNDVARLEGPTETEDAPQSTGRKEKANSVWLVIILIGLGSALGGMLARAIL